MTGAGVREEGLNHGLITLSKVDVSFRLIIGMVHKVRGAELLCSRGGRVLPTTWNLHQGKWNCCLKLASLCSNLYLNKSTPSFTHTRHHIKVIKLFKAAWTASSSASCSFSAAHIRHVEPRSEMQSVHRDSPSPHMEKKHQSSEPSDQTFRLI